MGDAVTFRGLVILESGFADYTIYYSQTDIMNSIRCRTFWRMSPL